MTFNRENIASSNILDKRFAVFYFKAGIARFSFLEFRENGEKNDFIGHCLISLTN